MDVFCDLVAAIDHPNFGVNYDPSNAFLAGDDPIELLKRVSDRVVTMHGQRSLPVGRDPRGPASRRGRIAGLRQAAPPW